MVPSPEPLEPAEADGAGSAAARSAAAFTATAAAPAVAATAAAASDTASAAAADSALAAHVAAWHNRHPLAVRVRPAQVLGLGAVALPVRAAGSAARRIEPAFSESFVAPITPRQAAAFAARHGVKERPDVSPLREVPADAAGGAALQTLYLRTVAIEAAGQRVRVLVAAGAPGRSRPAVLGPRLWSLRRALFAAALGGAGSTALVAGVVGALWLVPAAPGAPVWLAVTVAASAPGVDPAASVAMSTSASASAPPIAVPASLPPAAAREAAAAQAASAAAAVPAGAASAATVTLSDAGKTDDDVAAPADIRPRLTDEQRAEARRLGRQLRGEGESAAAAASAAAPPAEGRHYALVTRITRGRAASQVMQSLMSSAAAGAALPGQPRTEVMQVKEGFRAIWWPFASPADAEVARAALTAYGINAEVVEF
jgi:hypothetical protein